MTGKGASLVGSSAPMVRKTRWLKGSHLPCGELPLRVLRGDPAKPVFVIEGTAAKPWMIHLRTGASVIGIAGGCWNSPIQIQQLKAMTPGQEWILLPDGDAIYNHKVLDSYSASMKPIVTEVLFSFMTRSVISR